MGKKVVIGITGGPCAGKTSVLSMLSERVSLLGWNVYVLKESATTLIEQGMRLKQAAALGDLGRVVEYEAVLMRHNLENLAVMERCAEIEGGDSLFLVDRWIPDILPYLPEGREGREIYANLLAESGLTEIGVMERCNAVIKLTTAADGAERFYALANNAARTETPAMARRLDGLVEKAYLGHPHLRVVGNRETDFEGKKAQVLREVCAVLGVPAPLEIERKYRMDEPDLSSIPVPYRTVEIEQAYIIPWRADQEEVRVRRRSFGAGAATYYLTEKKGTGLPGQRVEVEEMIPWRRFAELMRSRDRSRGIVRKKRHFFLWENQYFELDVFENPPGVCILEVELTEAAKEIVLPPFLPILEEVTEDLRYRNFALALRAGEYAA